MIRNPEQYYPRKLGLRYNPPAIIIEYSLVNQQRTMYHKILIPTLQIESQILAAAIRKQHSLYFHNNRITEGNIRKLIDKLKRGATNRNHQQKRAQPKTISQQLSQDRPLPSANKNTARPEKLSGAPSKPVSDKEVSQINQYYQEQFEEFEGSQSSKPRAEQSYQSIKKNDAPFQFLGEEGEPSESSKPSPFSQSKPSVEQNKKPEKPMPILKPEIQDCFQYL